MLPLERVLPRAQGLAEQLATKPQLLTRCLAVTPRQRISRRIAEGTQLGMALEGRTAADRAYGSGGRSVTAADRWIGALHDSSQRLGHAVADRLTEASFAEGWTIGQVLSHLSSGVEISTALVERGLKRDERGPVREELLPVWEWWDAMSPVERRGRREADECQLALLDSVDPRQRTSLRVPYFAGLLDLASYAGQRLYVQAVHAGDVMVAPDRRAVLAAPDVVLLWERIDLVATRFRNADALTRLAPQRVQAKLTDPSHRPHRPPDGPRGVGTAARLWPQPPSGPPDRHRHGHPRRPADALPRFLTGLRSAAAVTAHGTACDPPPAVGGEPSGSPRPEERWNHEHFTRNHSRSHRQRHGARHLRRDRARGRPGRPERRRPRPRGRAHRRRGRA
ncbi:hypothetical protein [Streptomyces sp. NPDC096311]|uniref:hypothetical protein n=1 Tax=Streptomyces sp. NPDC096311 TaxID=3366083 RepID=UPI003809B4C0